MRCCWMSPPTGWTWRRWPGWSGFWVHVPWPVLFVSHDETLLERTANRIIHLEQIRRKTQPRCTVYRSDYRTYVTQRRNQLDHQEQVARKEREDYARQMARYRQIRDKVDHQLNTISRQDPHGGRLLKKKMKAVQSTAVGLSGNGRI